jgi:hypothetical protein
MTLPVAYRENSMRRQTALNLAILVCLALVAAPAFAGKGGNGGGGSGGSGGSGGAGTTSSSIAIASVDGVAAAPTLAPAPKLYDTVTFATSATSLAGWEYPMVVVSCYQDVNQDGVVDTSLLGPDLVFSWLDKPSATFTLGGYSSIWTQRGGGSAVCRAELDAYGWKGGSESIRPLAATANWTAAG